MLSSFMRQQAEQAHDSRIPASRMVEIQTVERAERAYDRSLGPAATAWRSVLAAMFRAEHHGAGVRPMTTLTLIETQRPTVIRQLGERQIAWMKARGWIDKRVVVRLERKDGNV
jgi:hypothetical protein